MPHKSKINLHVPDYLRKAKRGPQVILPKDAGIILTYSGMDKNSKVVEAGSGSGYMTVQMARFCKRVTSYEKDEGFYKLVSGNLVRLGIKNVKLKHQDVLAAGADGKIKGITEKNVDLVFLDMPDSHLAIPSAYKALKPATGCLVGYNPNMEQVKQFALTAREVGFKDDFTIEVIVREILVRDYGVRPASIGLTHTGYITFCWKRE